MWLSNPFFTTIRIALIIFISGISTTMAAVDPSAATVGLQPGDSLNDVRVFVGADIAGPITLHPEFATFSLRQIGSTIESSISATSDDPRPRPCVLKSGYPECYIGYHFTWPKLRAGAYELRVHSQVGFVSGPSGDMPIAQSLPGQESVNYYIPAAPVPVVAIGAQFVATNYCCAPIGSLWTLVNFEDVPNGQTISTFRATNRKLFEHRRTLSVSNGEGFAQVVNDPTIHRLRETYVDKPLWTYGRFFFHCRDPRGEGAMAETRDRSPLYIASIYRVHTFVRTTLGSADPLYYCQGACHESYHVFTDEPILVVLKPHDRDIQIVPPRFITRPWMYKGPCVSAPAVYFLDDWAFERVFTLEDPHTAHPEWSPQQRQDILNYQFDNGMDHLMVAFAAGYPSFFGTRAELEKLLAWEWYPGSNGSQSYYFDENRIFGGGWSWNP